MWNWNLTFVDHSSCEVLWKHLVPWNTGPSIRFFFFFPVLMFGGVGGGQGSCWVPGWNHKDTEDTKSSRQCRGLPFHNISRAILRAKAKDPGGGNPFIFWESEWIQQHAQTEKKLGNARTLSRTQSKVFTNQNIHRPTLSRIYSQATLIHVCNECCKCLRVAFCNNFLVGIPTINKW